MLPIVLVTGVTGRRLIVPSGCVMTICTVSSPPSGVISSCALASGMAIIRMAQSARAVSLRMICFMLYPPLQVNQGLTPMNRCV